MSCGKADFGAPKSQVEHECNSVPRGSLGETTEHISKQFRLTEEERRKLLSGGQETIINNRVGWTGTYMAKVGLLVAIRRGYFGTTERGGQVLGRNPSGGNVPITSLTVSIILYFI